MLFWFGTMLVFFKKKNGKIFLYVLAILTTIISATTPSVADYVNGYTRKDGTYVEPHYRSSPNSTQQDNYGTYGNVNPYTGQRGTRKCGLYDSCN